MGRRDDFIKTVNHQKPDRLIVDFGGNPLSCMEGKSMQNLMDFLGFTSTEKRHEYEPYNRIDEKILKYFDIPTRAVGSILIPQKSISKRVSTTEYIDEWGITKKYTGMYWDIVKHPLKGATTEDLLKYPWPDPDTIDYKLLEYYEDRAKQLNQETDYIICGEHPVFGIFELGCWMCGFDDFLTRLALDEEFVHTFFEIILKYQKKVIELYYGHIGKYIHYTSSGDDFATQTNLFMSKPMFIEYIKPYFKERIEYTKKFTGAKYLHHSCGNVHDIIDVLVDCGVDILNPIQPANQKMKPENLKQKFGDIVVFHGGIDTQAILPNGNKEIIEHTIKETIQILSENGGYIFAAAHNIQEDVPPQNIVYMLEAANKYGRF